MIMNIDRTQTTQRILDLTLEIIYLLTGEDHIVVKVPGERFDDRSSCQVSEGYCRNQSLSMEKMILELTHRILRLLTGEVPIRCEDVTVHLSMEEWEYVERHKELYKDLMMEDHQPVITAGKSVSGESLAPVSLSDFGTNDGGKCLKINKATKGRAESTTYTEHENPAYEERHVSETDIYLTPGRTGYPPDIKEESDSCEEGDLTDRDVYKPPDPTSTHIKEESNSCEGDITDPDIYPHPQHTQTAYTIAIKRELPTYEEGNLTDTDLCKPPKHTQTERIPDSVQGHINSSYSSVESRKPDKSIYRNVDVSPADSSTDPNSHNPVIKGNLIKPSELWKVSDSESDLVIRQTNCREISSDCEETFTRWPNPLEIQEVHTKEPFSECENCFSGVIALKIHQRIHAGKRLFNCTECEKCFPLHSELVRHQRIHTGEKPFKCTECGKCFIQAAHLATHKLIHTGVKTFKCTECGKGFTQASSLVRHKMIHTGEKPFKCPDCGECFTWSTQLASHKWVHSGEKPFSCSECGKWFSLKTQLNKHLKTHAKEKPITCTECGKGFSRSLDFAVHKMAHTGEKPFSCTKCGKCFSRKGNLNRHQKVHGKKNPCD